MFLSRRLCFREIKNILEKVSPKTRKRVKEAIKSVSLYFLMFSLLLIVPILITSFTMGPQRSFSFYDAMVFIGSALKLPFLLIRRDVPQFLWLIISSVLVTLIVAILLFDVKRKKQALSYLKNKQPWHILLGYFVAISALYPLFTRAIYNVVGLPKLISTTKDVAMLQNRSSIRGSHSGKLAYISFTYVE